jgi:hypothetical protein
VTEAELGNKEVVAAKRRSAVIRKGFSDVDRRAERRRRVCTAGGLARNRLMTLRTSLGARHRVCGCAAIH